MKKSKKERLDCIGGLEDITPQEVVRVAMKIASNEVRLPKCVRDGVVKKTKKDCTSEDYNGKITLEKEALEYAMTKGEVNPEAFSDEQIGRLHGYIDGVNSKRVHTEKIKAQLECLNRVKDLDILTVYRELKQRLKEFEDE